DVRLPAPAGGPGRLGRGELGIGQDAYGGARLLLDVRFARARAAVPAVGEAAGVLHELHELLLRDPPDGVGLAPLRCGLEQSRLDFVERRHDAAREPVEFDWRLAPRSEERRVGKECRARWERDG